MDYLTSLEKDIELWYCGHLPLVPNDDYTWVNECTLELQMPGTAYLNSRLGAYLVIRRTDKPTLLLTVHNNPILVKQPSGKYILSLPKEPDLSCVV